MFIVATNFFLTLRVNFNQFNDDLFPQDLIFNFFFVASGTFLQELHGNINT